MLALEITTIALLVACIVQWFIELKELNRLERQENMAQKTVELINQDRQRTRAGKFKI